MVVFDEGFRVTEGLRIPREVVEERFSIEPQLTADDAEDGERRPPPQWRRSGLSVAGLRRLLEVAVDELHGHRALPDG